MSAVVELLRPEAVEAQRFKRDLPKADPMQRSLAPLGFFLLAAAVAALVWATFVVRVEESAVGRARVGNDRRTMVVALPAGAQPSLRPGLRVTLDVEGQRVHGVLTTVDSPLAADSAARIVGGGAMNDAAVSSIATAEIDEPVQASLRGRTGKAAVLLGRRPLWEVVAPARLFRRGGDNG